MNASNKEDRISVKNEKNKMSVSYGENKMRTQYGKNKMSLSYEKNKMSVVEGDNRVKSTSPSAHQNHPRHSKSKSKSEIGFRNGISLGILSATRDSAILSVLFNIILIIGK